MTQVKIMRAIPGGGKSTYISNNFSHAVVCSADHYFIKNGYYLFNARDLGKAHNACKEKFDLYTLSGEDMVVVDNTNVRESDVNAYIKLALKNNVPLDNIEVIQLDVDPIVAHKRNIHNVPFEAVLRMHEQLGRPMQNIHNVKITRIDNGRL